MYVCVSVSALSMVPQLRPSIVTVNLGISSQTIKWKTVAKLIIGVRVIVGLYSSQYAENNSQYAENGSQYVENSSQYVENSSQYAENSSQYAEIGFKTRQIA